MRAYAVEIDRHRLAGVLFAAIGSWLIYVSFTLTVLPTSPLHPNAFHPDSSGQQRVVSYDLHFAPHLPKVTMLTSGWLLVSLGIGYLLVSYVRSLLRTKRRTVTLADTLLANVLQNTGQH